MPCRCPRSCNMQRKHTKTYENIQSTESTESTKSTEASHRPGGTPKTCMAGLAKSRTDVMLQVLEQKKHHESMSQS